MLTSTQFSPPASLKHGQYGEVDQSNAIRWVIYHKNGDHFEACTAVFKCRDFFNDVVAYYHGVEYTIYSFDNAEIKLNDDGIYILLKNVVPTLAERLEKVLGDDLPEGFSYTITDVDDGTKLLFLSNEFLEKTYYISYITLLIRAVNTTQQMDGFEDLSKSSDLVVRYQFGNMGKYRMTLPDVMEPFWWYMAEDQNSIVLKETPRQYLAHHCGIAAIYNSLETICAVPAAM